MSKNNQQSYPDITERRFTRMLGEEAGEKLGRFHMHQTMYASECLMKYDDQGPRAVNPPIIPYAPLEYSRVYTGTRETGSYNHHSQVAWFKNKYYFAWSNGIVDEEAAGQRILVSGSDDARTWSAPVCVAGDKSDPVLAQNCVAMKATDDTLYVIGKKEDAVKDTSVTGMRRIDPESFELNVFASDDGERWEKVFRFTERLVWIFEEPRMTADGNLMCVSTLKEGPAILRWPGKELCENPDIIDIPQPAGASFPYGESTWYQTDDGTIIIFWRDEGKSCRAWVNYSTDRGKTFSEPAISDIPDSMSRIYTGRLADGRYFLCNNAFPVLLDRMYLMLLLGDNGYEFNKVYMLRDDPTAQRLAGLLKANGYQYPNCLSEENRLIVGYSVNKEDIECAIVDVGKI